MSQTNEVTEREGWHCYKSPKIDTLSLWVQLIMKC